jgi:anti-sigma regulatory factor (Ser/Thr protein kinase)/Fe-S-cluster-containing hydrogenase component 2
MKIALYMIEGGDFKKAGAATESLKKLLKKINLDPLDMRRTIIAAFEAEMNVVIHAYKGSMRVILDSNEVEVRDQGPGIPDIEQAMLEGFSTASPAARQLGYGAGLGLPNMKKKSDVFEIASEPGKGTTVTFGVHFRALASGASGSNSLTARAGLCRECMSCVRSCPTKAIRVRGSGPEIRKDLCIDCGACLEACHKGAISTIPTFNQVIPARDALLVVQAPFLAQFSADALPRQVFAAIRGLGFKDVYLVENWADSLRSQVAAYAEKEARALPVISPMCPAVVNLVRLCFHSLLENVAPFLSPLEAAQRDFSEKPALFLAICPAQITSLLSKIFSKTSEVIIPATLRRAVQPLVAEVKSEREALERLLESEPETEGPPGALCVSGMKHVMRALEKVENGRLKDVRILELYACEHGCYGSPLFSEEPFVAAYRWRRARGKQKVVAKVHRRGAALTALTGMRLDSDPARALAKMSQIESMIGKLPGKDCAMCGAPGCAALAEDIVQGRCGEDACLHLFRERGGES